MKFRNEKVSPQSHLAVLSDFVRDNFNIEKLLLTGNELSEGLENFLRFQKYPNYRWPAWVEMNAGGKTGSSYGITHPLLINNILGHSLSFSNSISKDEIYIEPSGGISLSYGAWSLEFWILLGDTLYRPQEDPGEVRIKRDPATSIVEIVWKNKVMQLKQIIYGARSNTDEAVIESECTLNTPGRDAHLIISVRPYNNRKIGGLNVIEFNKSARVMKINDRKSLAVDDKPEFINAGNGEAGDVVLNTGHDVSGIVCKKGMASMSLGYKLKKGANSIYVRLSLDSHGDLSHGKIDFTRLKRDYIDFSKFRINSGMNLSTPDSEFNSWFYASKSSVLNFLDKEAFLDQDIDSFDCRKIFYMIFGFNRMGYVTESKKYVDLIISKYIVNEKNMNFSSANDVFYIINSFADYFIHTRDLDYLQLNYLERLKKFGTCLFKYSSTIKKVEDLGTNTIDERYMKEPRYDDLILMAYSLYQFSYLARCLGIFDDEKRFMKEYERIENIFLKYAGEYESRYFPDEFFYYDLQSAYPFRMENITGDITKSMIERIIKHFNADLLHNKSLGFDIFPSIIFITNLIIQKDSRAIEIIRKLFQYGGENYSLPEFINPSTGKGGRGRGASKLISSLIFSMIRNFIFIDTKERLDIFPVPVESWFKPGVNIIVDDAPSRFGRINFNVKTTSNEIQFYFNKLPKYIPPDIMINLPFKVEIVEGDDFIVKKIVNNTFIIHGWPALVRFLKKQH